MRGKCEKQEILMTINEKRKRSRNLEKESNEERGKKRRRKLRGK